MDNRIGSVSLVATSARQTPHNEFGRVLARGIAGTSAVAAGAASAFIPGGAVISAAVTQTALGAGTSGFGGAAPVPVSGAAGPVTTGTTGTPATQLPDGLQGQRELMQQNQQWTAQYLALQNEMQRESREFTAVSNILKVRHESSKTAINNIR